VGLQGIRLAHPTLGEKFVIFGLGLIGLLTLQILRANGCAVMGVDPNQDRCRLAMRLGANQVSDSVDSQAIEAALNFSGHDGVDGVIITAATTDDQPIHLAAQMCRRRGRIILVGSSGLKLRRDDFYKKELSFQVSCSYGPGRYDPKYEKNGYDYPLGLVRWTLNRNFEAVLGLLVSHQLEVEPLISHNFSFNKAPQAYEMISQGSEPYLGVILHYETPKRAAHVEGLANTVQLTPGKSSGQATDSAVVGVIGAGNFTGRVALPALASSNCRLDTIASSGGLSAANLGAKFGFRQATTDLDQIFASADINAVYIATRHGNHAELVMRSLESRKSVLVEKPLCISHAQLDEIKNSLARHGQGRAVFLMVGFNRRFAPMIQSIKKLLKEQNEPICLEILVNAGKLPADHWTLDPEQGGGRLVGEACHFIDLCRFLTDSSIVAAQGARLGRPDASSTVYDKLQITLAFANGSLASIQYLANGHRSFPKERIEIFCCGKVIKLDNFRTIRGYGWRGLNKHKNWLQDKGHQREISAWIDAVARGSASPIPLAEIIEVTQVSLDLAQGLQDSAVCQLQFAHS
jgi:predicted dehydrogenase